MILKEDAKPTGHIKFDLYDSEGKLKETREIHNVVVTVGKNYLASWLTASAQTDYFMRYLALGTGVTPATAADTVMEIESATRVAGTLSSATNVWQNQGTFNPGVNTGSITEAGIFSASSGGTMLAHQVFPVITKQAGDTLQVTWQITIS
jgi:hypothetical protein